MIFVIKHTNLSTAYYPRIYNPISGFVFLISASSRLNIPCFLSTIEYLFAHCDYFRFLSIIIFAFPLDYRFSSFGLLDSYVLDFSIHMFWTSRFICFGLLDSYVLDFSIHMFSTSRFICFRLRFLHIRLRIRNIRLRLQKQSTSIEILLFVFLSATERHSLL